jgi:hypothetical protein
MSWVGKGCPSCCPYHCVGPCYDLCMCSHCWKGWDGMSWSDKLYYRIEYLVHEAKLKAKATLRHAMKW